MSRSNIAKAAVLLASLSLAGSVQAATPISPFSAMAGSWSGGGSLSTTDGMQERLRWRQTEDFAPIALSMARMAC
jgi:hypothetical protein